MKKRVFYLILLITGILNGYILIVSLGYLSASDLSFNIIKCLFHSLKEHELLYFGRLVLYIENLILLSITAIPIFLIFGFFLSYFLRLKPSLMGWIHSIGVLMVFFYSFIAYNGPLTSLILESLVIIALNMLIFTKISKAIEVRTKS